MDSSHNLLVKRTVQKIVGSSPSSYHLLQYLIKIQSDYNYIPSEAIQILAVELGLSQQHINSVISFYSFLYLDFAGDYRVLFSDNITDRMFGNSDLYQQFESLTEGLSVSLGYTSCTGLCDQGPAVLINGYAIPNLSPNLIQEISTLIKVSKPVKDWPSHIFCIADNIKRKDFQLNSILEQGDALSKIINLDSSEILRQLECSGLRGRGGAGFLTATKWKYCIQSKSNTRYVVCNADEGEPGTFKDRVLLQSYTNSVIEGMTVCAKTIGATHGFIYLRGEYRFLLENLEQVLQQRRSNGLLGQNILGNSSFNFDIDIHLGAGAYICGEESALIESLEGKRGIPRIRPPFPVESGYDNQPTVVNNVETFWSITNIFSSVADVFESSGTELSKGSRLLSISGDCEFPGIYEYSFGVSIAEILKGCGAIDTQAVQMAGAAGTTVLAKDFHRKMSFEDLATGGSFMVIGSQRNLIHMLQNFAHFFKHESCGFCTPCRVGTQLISDLIDSFVEEKGSKLQLEQLLDISYLMKKTSFCGLGTSAITVFIDAIRQSPELLNNLITSSSDRPDFDLQKSLHEYKKLTGSVKEP